MASKNPKLARSKVARAKQSNDPVVDSDNTGYSDRSARAQAIESRFKKSQEPRRTPPRSKLPNYKKGLSSAIAKRMASGMMSGSNSRTRTTVGKFSNASQQTLKDEIITKRKEKGY